MHWRKNPSLIQRFHSNTTEADSNRPVEAAEHHGLAAGAGDRHCELPLRSVSAVVEVLQNLALPAVRHHLLIAAGRHDAVGAPS